MTATKHCASIRCGLPLVRREGERRDHFEKRITCGPRCQGHWQIGNKDCYKPGRPRKVRA
jgi:hypothetical protein